MELLTPDDPHASSSLPAPTVRRPNDGARAAAALFVFVFVVLVEAETVLFFGAGGKEATSQAEKKNQM